MLKKVWMVHSVFIVPIFVFIFPYTLLSVRGIFRSLSEPANDLVLYFIDIVSVIAGLFFFMVWIAGWNLVVSSAVASLTRDRIEGIGPGLLFRFMTYVCFPALIFAQRKRRNQLDRQ